MPEFAFLGLSLLLCMAAWHLALRKSIQDSYKDRLFDIRDEMRCHFAKIEQLDSEVYKTMRDTLNRYIRFVESAGLLQAYLFSRNMAANPELAAFLRERLDETFLFEDSHERRYARMVRRKCTRIIQAYVFHSSFAGVVLIYCVLLPCVFLWVMGSNLPKAASVVHRGVALTWERIQTRAKWIVNSRELRAIKKSNTELLSQVGLSRESMHPLVAA